MSEPGWSEVLAEHRAEESPAERAGRLARQAAERDDRQAVQAEAERAAAIEDERDRRLLAYQQLGIGARSVADLGADASRMAEEDDQFNEATRTIERIGKRRAARREAARFQAEQIDAVSRGAPPTDPLEAAQRRAHEAFRAATRAQFSQAVTGQPVSRRPKAVASRSRGGEAVRSELECWYCVQNDVSHEDSALLHLDPGLRVPITTREQAQKAEQAGPVERATRAEADRLIRLGYSPETAQYAATPPSGRGPMIYR